MNGDCFFFCHSIVYSAIHVLNNVLFYLYMPNHMDMCDPGDLNQSGYICSNRQKYIAWVKIIDFSFMPKIIRILSKYHVP